MGHAPDTCTTDALMNFYPLHLYTGNGKQTDLHYDHVFFGTRLERRETLLTCWLALTETSSVDGGLFVVENR